MKTKSFLSIIVPCFNEGRIIKKNLLTILDFLKSKKYAWELIVVDDGSRDGTSNVVQALQKCEQGLRLFSNEKNKGKGASVRRGVEEAKGEVIFFLDADLSTPLLEIDKFIPLTNKYDIVIGNREHSESQILIRQPFHRKFMGKFFIILSNLLLVKNIDDVTCGFKCFRSDVAKKIFQKQRINRWVFDAEILFIAQKEHFRIRQEPIHWADDRDSRVSLVKDTLGSFRDLFVIRLNNLLGRYRSSSRDQS